MAIVHTTNDFPGGEPPQPASPAPRSVNASLLAICQAMGMSLELREVLPTILHLSLEEMQAQQGSVLLFDEHQDQLKMLAAIGLPEEIRQKGYIPRKGSIAEWVIQHNQPLILNDHAETKDYCSLNRRQELRSSMCVPLRARGKVLGTINMNRTEASPAGPFQEGDLDIMMILASQAAACIENTRLHEANLKNARLAAIGQTVAGISHCIKNVLTGVRGGMGLVDMSESMHDWDLYKQGKGILDRNLERLYSIVMDMLDYSKERKPVKAPVSIGSLCEEALATVQSEAKTRDITLELRLDSEVKTVMADAQQLYRSVLNLLHNALDATPKGGVVWMSSERQTSRAAMARLREPDAVGAVILRVGDSGHGISEEHRHTIFDPFFSTKGSKGTGLGLAVTRKIVREHGGHIEVESAPGEPAIFAIYLPD